MMNQQEKIRKVIQDLEDCCSQLSTVTPENMTERVGMEAAHDHIHYARKLLELLYARKLLELLISDSAAATNSAAKKNA